MRPKQVYILPNLLTSVNVLAGVFCIIKSSVGGHLALWEAAAVLFIGMVADVFDGIIARLQRATSEFGVQFDSLADVISFGVAPAVLAYNVGLSKLPGRVGLAIAFLFTVCAALRLAKYNTQATTGEKKSFAGLPTPVSAGFLASATVVLIKYGYIDANGISDRLVWPLGLAVIVLSCLMISTVKYPSSADLIVVGRKPFVYLSVGTLIIAGSVFMLEESTLAGFTTYLVFGTIRYVYRFFRPLHELGAEVVRKPRWRLYRRLRRRKILGRFRRDKDRQPPS